MEQLGIDWKILIGQIINFAILLYLLKRFAYKPFFEILEKRKKTIEEGVKKSDQAQDLLQKTRDLSEKIRENAKDDAKKSIKEAEAEARALAQKILNFADKEKEMIIETAKKTGQKEIAEEKEKRQREAVEMAFLLAEKIIKENIDRQKDQDFIKETIQQLK